MAKTTRTLSVKEARKEIKKAKIGARRGPLAPWRLAATLAFSLLIGGRGLWDAVYAGENMLHGAKVFVAAFAIAWVSWGVIDASLAGAAKKASAAERRERGNS